MSRIIKYEAPKRIVVGIPFTWRLCNAWAIKVEDGDSYYLSNGSKVLESEEEILPDILYANRIEIQ
ncbi:hypothetical protein HOR62_gp12 [Klebsiella phage vB_KpnP_KpV74]|uniref:Uncharacterized protein n=1 Tax=Klebsiella phage vB_KpnP_KpV74 TaxID=1933773 RepID=A0A1P8VW45_BPK74|nr:hypothetical protein HOR62_gp12 [Klebsiella phage vB_KpnP_KpV74]APZ82724.1 hypothetical protein kpv74_12 [Klebsiella phage vB_KpnP_KpV74]